MVVTEKRLRKDSIELRERRFRKMMAKRKKTYVYLRVSTDEQETEKFIYDAKQYCVRKKLGKPIFIEETISATKTTHHQRKIDWILNQEDCKHVIAPDHTRLGRSMLDTQKIWAKAKRLGIIVHCIKENLVLDPMQPNIDAKFQFDIYGAFGEREGSYISFRTKEGLAHAKRKGVKLGGPRNTGNIYLKGKEEEICKMYEDGMNKKQIAEEFKVCPRTLYRFIDNNEDAISIICQRKKYSKNPSSGKRRPGKMGRRRTTERTRRRQRN